MVPLRDGEKVGVIGGGNVAEAALVVKLLQSCLHRRNVADDTVFREMWQQLLEKSLLDNQRQNLQARKIQQRCLLLYPLLTGAYLEYQWW